MTLPYASTDNTVLIFITSQNTGPDDRGGSGLYIPAILNNGIAGTTTNNVVGFSSLGASSSSPIAMGGGFNTVIVDGYNSASRAGDGIADNFSFTVDPTGLVTLTDTTTGNIQRLSGVSFLIFNGAATGTDSNGNPDYEQMYFIGGANQSEVTQLYNAAFGRQPDLGGVEYYMNQLKADYSFADIANEFMASPEFQARFGSTVSDNQFITNLYQNILHRAPATTELAYYAAALQNSEAGSIVNTTNPLMWSRTQELLNFTNSPENQSDTSGFVINTAGTTSNGLVYSTPTSGSQTGAQAIAQAAQTGVLDTTQISASEAATTTVGHVPTSPGSISILGATGPDAAEAASVRDYASSGIVILSSAVPNFSSGVNNSSVIVNGSTSGGDYIGLASGTVNLFSTGNIVSEGAAGAQPLANAPYTIITGWAPGDYLTLASTGSSQTYAFLSPTTSSPMQGGAVYGYHSTTPQSVIYVGNVGGGTPTEVAAAASKVYIPNDVAGEAAIFYGQTSSGGTAIYDWFNYTTAPNGADTHNDHTVHADNFAGGVILVGVASSSITASIFHS